MHKRVVLSVALSIGCGITIQSASAQENRGTWEQQMACTPDVWRLCSDQIPDANRIVACLRQNTPQLSNNCRAVFESNNSAPQPAPRTTQQLPRARAAPPPVQPRPYDDDE
jgi:hypothetical protein